MEPSKATTTDVSKEIQNALDGLAPGFRALIESMYFGEDPVDLSSFASMAGVTENAAQAMHRDALRQLRGGKPASLSQSQQIEQEREHLCYVS